MNETTASGSDPVTPTPIATTTTEANRFFRFLCTSNPFYAISAAMFLVGLRLSFGAHTSELDTWALTGGLVGYTLMLASAAVVLVRLASVWDDVRTVLLLVALMFVATSASFDEVLTLNQSQGVQLAIVGYAVAILVTVCILRGIRLRFPVLFRLPFYFILGVFFLYPALLSPLVKYPDAEILHWGLFAFCSAVAVAFLTLLPAVRHGADYVKDNGSPWRWPFYPWSLFVFLAVALPLRAYLMCGSLHVVIGQHQHSTLFAPWFVAPFVFVVGIIVLEIGIVANNRTTRLVGMGFPFLAVLLSFWTRGHDELAAGFLSEFINTVGVSPAFASLVGAMLFFSVAQLRRVPGSSLGIAASGFLFAIVPPQARSLADVTIPTTLILTISAVLAWVVGIWRWDIRWCLAGLLTMLLILSSGVLPEAWDPKLKVAIVIHTALLGGLLLGAIFREPIGELLRETAAMLLFLAAFCALVISQIPSNPHSQLSLYYGLAVATLLLVYGHVLRDLFSGVCGVLLLLIGVGIYAVTGYRSARSAMPGLDYLCVSLALFAVAILVSLGKGGVLPDRWLKFIRAARPATEPPSSTAVTQ